MTVAAILAAQSAGAAPPILSQDIRQTAQIAYSECLVRTEDDVASNFELVEDSRWSFYRYQESDGPRTEFGPFLTLRGKGRFAGWRYERKDKYNILGRAFRNNAGEILVIDYGVSSLPQVKILSSNGKSEFSKADILKKTITIAMVDAAGKTMTLYAGVCTLKKTETLPARPGVRDMAQ